MAQICWRCGAERPVELHILSGRSQSIKAPLCYECFKHVRAELHRYDPRTVAERDAAERHIIKPA